MALSLLMKMDLCSWVVRLLFIKDVQIHPSCPTDSAKSLSKVLTLQIIWKFKQLRVAKIILKKNKIGQFVLPSPEELLLPAAITKHDIGIRMEISINPTSQSPEISSVFMLN